MANLEQNREESVDSQREDHFVNLERRRDRDYNPTPSVMVETQHTKHTKRSHSKTQSQFHTSRKCVSWSTRLIICVKSCVEGNVTREIPYLHQVNHPGKVGIDPITTNLGLLLVNPFPPPHIWINWRDIGTSVEKAHLIEAWGMMQWARHFAKFQSHPLKGE